MSRTVKRALTQHYIHRTRLIYVSQGRKHFQVCFNVVPINHRKFIKIVKEINEPPSSVNQNACETADTNDQEFQNQDKPTKTRISPALQLTPHIMIRHGH